MKKFAIVLLALVAISSCTTISQGATEQEAQKFLNLLSEGQVEEALAMSYRPFLFESEILVSEGLVADLWNGLAGIDFSTAEVAQFIVVDENIAWYFSESWEIETYLQNYAAEDSALVLFNWDSREIVVLVDRSRSNDSPIMGFGEVK